MINEGKTHFFVKEIIRLKKGLWIFTGKDWKWIKAERIYTEYPWEENGYRSTADLYIVDSDGVGYFVEIMVRNAIDRNIKPVLYNPQNCIVIDFTSSDIDTNEPEKQVERLLYKSKNIMLLGDYLKKKNKAK